MLAFYPLYFAKVRVNPQSIACGSGCLGEESDGAVRTRGNTSSGSEIIFNRKGTALRDSPFVFFSSGAWVKDGLPENILSGIAKELMNNRLKKIKKSSIMFVTNDKKDALT